VSSKQVTGGSLVNQLSGNIPELQAELKAAKSRVSLIRKLLRLACSVETFLMIPLLPGA
jgi:hypothetical protein